MSLTKAVFAEYDLYPNECNREYFDNHRAECHDLGARCLFSVTETGGLFHVRGYWIKERVARPGDPRSLSPL